MEVICICSAQGVHYGVTYTRMVLASSACSVSHIIREMCARRDKLDLGSMLSEMGKFNGKRPPTFEEGELAKPWAGWRQAIVAFLVFLACAVCNDLQCG